MRSNYNPIQACGRSIAIHMWGASKRLPLLLLPPFFVQCEEHDRVTTTAISRQQVTSSMSSTRAVTSRSSIPLLAPTTHEYHARSHAHAHNQRKKRKRGGKQRTAEPNIFCHVTTARTPHTRDTSVIGHGSTSDVLGVCDCDCDGNWHSEWAGEWDWDGSTSWRRDGDGDGQWAWDG